jgi:hypothetical protein
VANHILSLAFGQRTDSLRTHNVVVLLVESFGTEPASSILLIGEPGVLERVKVSDELTPCSE